MADLKNASCPSCHQKYRLPDSIENRKVVCRACQVAFIVPKVVEETATGRSSTEQTKGGLDPGIFDSIDVDDLLNAQSSGLSPRRDETVSPTDDTTDDTPKKDARERPQQQEDPVSDIADHPAQPRPAERPAVLQTTVLARSKKKSKRYKRKKKKKKKNHAPKETSVESDFINSQSDRSQIEERKKGNDPIDPEEQAVFDYVWAVNRRKNTFAIVVAIALSIGIGGWFAAQEIDRLKTPLSQRERDILEDEGFRLKAVRGTLKGQFAALGKDVPRVSVAPGVRLDLSGEIKGPFPEKRFGKKFDPNAVFGNDRKPRRPVRREQTVDLDTRMGTEGESISFKVGKGKVRGPALAVSPRNVVFVPEGDGLASYDLVAKKQIDYKTVGRFAGTLDRISALAVTPDARFLITGFHSGRVKLFQLDAQSRFFEIRRLRQKHYKPIRQIVVSPDSSLFATVDTELQVAVSKAVSGENRWKRKIEIPQDVAGKQRHLDLAFSDDGQQLFVALATADVVLNAGNGNEIVRKPRRSRKSAVVAANARISISCYGSEISGHSIEADVELWKKSIRRTQFPIVALDAAGKTGLFFDGGKSIVNFDVQTGDLIGRLAPVVGSSHQSQSKLAVSVDGKFLLYGARNYAKGKLPVNQVNLSAGNATELPRALPLPLPFPPRNVPELWITEEGKRSRKLTRVAVPDSGKKIAAVTLDDDGLLFYATASGSLHVYDWTNRILLQEISIDVSKSISALAACGKWLAAGDNSGGILLYEVQPSGGLKSHGGVFGHDTTVVGIKAMPVKANLAMNDPSSIASVSRDGNLRVWDIPTRSSLLSVETIGTPPKELVVLDDRKILVASTTHLATVNPDTQKVTVEGSRNGGARVALSPDGKRLAFVNQNAIKIAKARTGVAGEAVPLDQIPGAIQFTRDSRFLQINFPTKVGIVNYKNGKTTDTIEAEIRPHTALETLFAVSPKGTLMAAVAKDGTSIIILPVEE